MPRDKPSILFQDRPFHRPILGGIYQHNRRSPVGTSASSSNILDRLENAQLSAVTFVQDYVQLHFDGPYLNAYVWPTVKEPKKAFERDTPGYRDALCKRIGKLVVKAYEDAHERLVMQFADGVTLEVSLKEADREGPEAAMFQDPADKHWNVW
jgi:hypothetical protein